jgi:RNA polymerase sigma-70 factor (ECF subfamily)
MIYHVVHYTSYLRSVSVGPEDVEDIAAEILLQIVADDYAVLRQFRGKSSLATYLTVVARRICVHELARRMRVRDQQVQAAKPERDEKTLEPGGVENHEEVEKLLRKLPAREREVVRLYYLEGRSYEEISSELHIPVNTIGPVLHRAKKRLRDGAAPSPAADAANK